MGCMLELETLIVETSADPAMTIVMLHGYAMQPQDLAPFAHSLGMAARFVFPYGPLTATPSGRAWWPMEMERRAGLPAVPRDLAHVVPPDREPVRAALSALCEQERRAAPGRPLVLVGFSQGGMLACDTVLHHGEDVRALALLSSSCIDIAAWQARTRRLAKVACFVAHGRGDDDLAFAAGERLRDLLSPAAESMRWLAFDGGHQIPLVVWRELRRFLRELL
jgi:phospholipase/carboxylesterase